MKRFFIFLIIFFLFFLSCPCCAFDNNLKKVSFIPLWKPQAQFAGYFAAFDKGIYKKYGLDVIILEGGSDYPSIEALKSGKADFGVMWLSDAIQQRSSGVKIVNVAQVVQKSALMLAAKKANRIQRPEDFQGRKVSLWEGGLSLQPKAFFRKYGLDVKIVPQTYSINLFLAGGVDAACVMMYNEYDTIINSGVDPDELSTFLFSDYGLNFPEDGIYCLESTLDKDPETVSAFVQASLEGWRYVFEHKKEALDIVLKYIRAAHLPANRVHQEWMLTKMEDIIFPRDMKRPPGYLNKDDFALVLSELEADGLMKDPLDYKVFFRPAVKNVQE